MTKLWHVISLFVLFNSDMSFSASISSYEEQDGDCRDDDDDDDEEDAEENEERYRLLTFIASPWNGRG